MMSHCSDIIQILQDKTVVTAESCTGGGIGSAITSIPGSSAVYKGGIICYSNSVKEQVLSVDHMLLERYGAVSEPVARQMAKGVRRLLNADWAISVTGLAGPSGDDFGNPVGTVYIGIDSNHVSLVCKYVFEGDRAAVRTQAVEEALQLLMKCIKEEPAC